jgi:flagellar assembly protein FliH
MTATKFLFDTPFDLAEPLAPLPAEPDEDAAAASAEPVVELPPPPPTFSEEEMAAARAESLAAGIEQGRAEILKSLDAKAVETAGQLLAKVDSLFRAEAESVEESAREAVRVAAAIARKLFPYLNQRHGVEEVEQLVRVTLQRLTNESSVIIRLNDSLRDKIDARLTAVATDSGFAGRTSIVGSAEIPVGDCRIEWASGGAGRDTAALWQEIDTIIASNIGAETAAPGAASGDAHG